MLRKAEHERVNTHELRADELGALVPRYLRCLAELKLLLQRERGSQSRVTDCVLPLPGVAPEQEDAEAPDADGAAPATTSATAAAAAAAAAATAAML